MQTVGEARQRPSVSAGARAAPARHIVSKYLRHASVVLLMLGGASACTSAPRVVPQPRAADTDPALKGMQCEMQRATGSLVATRVCTLAPQREAIKQSTQDARDFLERQRIGACPGTPGCKP